MEYLIGVVLALAISIGATAIGLDRERAFYSVVLMVVASYYALFAIMGGSVRALLAESLPITLFLLAAGVGFKKNMWLVAIGLIAHGVFDLLHGRVISNPGVPTWWPGFCMAYDVTAGAYLAYRLKGTTSAPKTPSP